MVSGRHKGEIPAEECAKRSYRNKPHPKEGDDAKYLAHSLKCQSWGKVDMNDPEDLKNRIKKYFDACVEDDCKPGIEGLALSLHVSRDYLRQIHSGIKRHGQKQGDIISDAYQIVSSQMEQYMLNGDINPIVGIFLMCNNNGYEQKSTRRIEHEEPIKTDMTQEQLQNRYADVIDVKTQPHKQLETGKKNKAELKAEIKDAEFTEIKKGD
jgi:hypothetical protein